MVIIYYCFIAVPEILINPKDATMLVGQSEQLMCNAIGTDVVYQWLKDGLVLSGANSSILRFAEIKESDEGVYKCVVSNKAGRVEASPAAVTVYGKQFVQDGKILFEIILDVGIITNE